MSVLSRYTGKRVSDIAIMKSLHLLMVANISIQEALRRIAQKLPDSEMADRLAVASDMVSREGRTLPEAIREVGLFEKYVDLIEMARGMDILTTSVPLRQYP